MSKIGRRTIPAFLQGSDNDAKILRDIDFEVRCADGELDLAISNLIRNKLIPVDDNKDERENWLSLSAKDRNWITGSYLYLIYMYNYV
jgi:hypothetical protein